MRKEQFQYIDKKVEEQIKEHKIAGASLKIWQNNEEIYEVQKGYADLENLVSVKKDTIFRIYSMTKPVTAVAAMILYERGMLDLFTPVSCYLEGFRDQKVYENGRLVPVHREARIKDLLNMTSGLVYPGEDHPAKLCMKQLFDKEKEDREIRGKKMTTVEFCNEIGRQPLLFSPGEGWNYGTGADVLGAVIEVITGKSLGRFMEEEIFAPLGMKDTGFYVPEEKWGRFSKIYEYDAKEKNLKLCDWTHLGITDYKTPPVFEAGGAGLVSTVDDYGKFAHMLLNKGEWQGTRILGRKTAEFLSSNQLTDFQLERFKQSGMNVIEGYGYGNFMRSMMEKSEASSNGSIGEYGWSGWCGTYFFVDPEEKLVMIYCIQRCDEKKEIIKRLRNILYGLID